MLDLGQTRPDRMQIIALDIFHAVLVVGTWKMLR